MNNFGEKVSFIWSVADLLRGPYRPNQYKDVMLPLTVLRRLDCVLEPTKDEVLAELKKRDGGKVRDLELLLRRKTGLPFYNTSRYSFERLKGESANVAANLVNYIKGFSPRARDIIEQFGFEEHIAKLDKADRERMAGVTSHLQEVSTKVLSEEVNGGEHPGFLFVAQAIMAHGVLFKCIPVSAVIWQVTFESAVHGAVSTPSMTSIRGLGGWAHPPLVVIWAGSLTSLGSREICPAGLMPLLQRMERIQVQSTSLLHEEVDLDPRFSRRFYGTTLHEHQERPC